MTTLRTTLSAAVALLFGALILTGCDDSSTGSNAEVNGSMNLRLTDAPLDSAEAVNVTIEEIYLVREDGDDDEDGDSDGDDGDDSDDDGNDDEDGEESRVPVYRPDTPQTINLLDYQNESLTLAEGAEVPAGTYTQMRLVLTDDNEVVFPSGSQPLQTPSAQTSGYKILLPEIEVDDDADVIDLTLDFDASQSVILRGNGTYLLRPVIEPTSLQFNGEEIEDDGDTEVAGDLNNVNTSGPTVTVEGVTFTATSETDYDGVDGIDGLTSFSYASVEATRNEDGTYTAEEIEALDAPQYYVEGPVEAVGTSSLTIAGIEVQVTDETSYEDGSTLDALQQGDVVEVEFTKETGTRTAVSIELED